MLLLPVRMMSANDVSCQAPNISKYLEAWMASPIMIRSSNFAWCSQESIPSVSNPRLNKEVNPAHHHFYTICHMRTLHCCIDRKGKMILQTRVTPTSPTLQASSRNQISQQKIQSSARVCWKIEYAVYLAMAIECHHYYDHPLDLGIHVKIDHDKPW